MTEVLFGGFLGGLLLGRLGGFLGLGLFFRLGADDDGDVGHALLDGSARATSTRHETRKSRSRSGDGARDDHLGGVELVIVLGIGNGGAEGLADEERTLFRGEVEDAEGLAHGHAGDGAGDLPCLLRRDPGILVCGADGGG